MAESSDDRDVLLNRLADEVAARQRAGERPRLEEFCDRHPELADDIRSLFPALVELERAKADAGPDLAVALADAPAVTQLGDFRLLREVGRGGMGVVYEAEQVSLGRRVAIKLLPATVFREPTKRLRFEREAKAAAKLHHTNIVPVHGFGEHDGTPYYVMQFIPGLGLDAVIDELAHFPAGGRPPEPNRPRSKPEAALSFVLARSLVGADVAGTAGWNVADDAPTVTAAGGITPDPARTSRTDRGSSGSLSASGVQLPGQSKSGLSGTSGKKTTYWESVARIGVQVAGALAYAHKLGVLHRDIKPANLLLDLDGVVWVTDFGLAKADDSDNLTHTGDLLGTLRYMPPEAFEGKADARSDVYALGLTLYELVALRPAYDERDRNKLVKQVTSDDAAPQLRKIRKDAPWDLVTIVEKAIDKDPAHRYQTAAALADDLQRFLNDEPIQARRQTQLERYVRWARHNPGIATLGGVLTAVLVLVTVASLLAAGHFNRLHQNEAQAARNERGARHEADQSQQAERLHRERAEEAAAAALAALKEADTQRDLAREQREVSQRNLYYAQMHLARQSWREHRGLGHMRELLTAWLPQGESSDRRGWEWFYLNSLPYQNVRTFTEPGNGGRPTIVAWHVPSQRLAEGTSDGQIRIWDVDRERTTLTLSGTVPVGVFWGAHWLVWSPNGDKLATGCRDGTVHLWDTATGREVTVFREHKSAVVAVAYSSDGTRLAAWGLNGAVKVWDADTGRLIEDVVHPGGVSAGAWSPDGKFLACGHNNGTITISGAHAGDKVETVKAHVDVVYRLAWSPNGQQVASTGGDFTVKLWDVASRKLVLGPLRHSHGVASVAWEPDGKRLATGSFDETIKVWDTTTGREALTLRGHVQTITSLAWGPNGRLASGCNDGSLKVWDGVRDQESGVLPGHGVRATSVAWSPNGKRLASGGDDGKVRIWDPATGEEVLSIAAHNPRQVYPQFGLIRTLAWSPDGTHLASGGLDGAAKVWAVADGRQVFALPAEHGRVWTLAWNSDGDRLAVGSEDGTIRVVEPLKQDSKVHEFKAHQGRARGLAWSPQGDRLATVGTDGLLKLWDPVRGVELRRMQGHQGGVFTVAWSPDGKQVVSAGNDRSAVAWDATTGERLATMRGHNDWVDAVVWSPDGTRLASAGIDNSVRVWNPRTGEEAFVLRGDSGMFHDVAWHPDGARIAAASSDGRIWVWDATSGFEHDTTPRAVPYIDRKLAGQPAHDVERLRFARLAADHKKLAVAARLWAEALDRDPKLGDDRQARYRYHAARAASAAAAGQSRDEPRLDDATKAKLRGQALGWLRAELTAWGERLDSGPPQERETVVLTLSSWRHEPDLAGVRDAAIAGLPAEERTAFTGLWADVTAVLKTASEKHAAFLREKLPEARQTLPPDSTELAYVLAQIGRSYLDLGQWAEAELVLRECLAVREKVVPESWTTFNTYSSLGGALLGQGKHAEAEPLLLKGYAGMKQREATIPLIGKDRLPDAADRLVEFYTATNKPDELKSWKAERAKYPPAIAAPPRAVPLKSR